MSSSPALRLRKVSYEVSLTVNFEIVVMIFRDAAFGNRYFFVLPNDVRNQLAYIRLNKWSNYKKHNSFLFAFKCPEITAIVSLLRTLQST